MAVHNHGTEEGKGLACRESLKGECMLGGSDDMIRALLALHSKKAELMGDRFRYVINLCSECRQDWPCRTVRILTYEESHENSSH